MNVTEQQAKLCAAYVKGRLGPEYEVALYPPGHEGNFWCISLEGAGDWALELSSSWPKGLFGAWVEPVAGWCLALYAE